MAATTRSKPADGLGALSALGAAYVLGGLAMAGVPGRVAAAVAGPSTPAPSWVVRVLGIRYLAQGVAELLLPEREIGAAGVVVDGLHAVSMLPAAVTWPRLRRSAAISGSLAAAGALFAGRAVQRG